MISNTAAAATSLFQYIDDQRSGSQVIGETGEANTQNKSQESDDKQMKHVTVQSLDNLVDKVMSGESKISAEKMDDMLNFYFDQVKADVKGLSDEYSIDNTPALHLIEDKWQSEKGNSDRDLRQFRDSLNGDIQLSQRIDKVLKLSELNEQVIARGTAQSLKREGVSDPAIESFLMKVSSQIQVSRSVSVENGDLKLHNSGIAKQELTQFTQT